jgi:hypothetical protein
VQDFLAEFIEQPCVLVGNSVGSLVVLTVRCSGFTFSLFTAAGWFGVHVRPSGQAHGTATRQAVHSVLTCVRLRRSLPGSQRGGLPARCLSTAQEA